MKALRGVIVLVLTLALPAPVLAADYQAGLEAYERGDYATALKEWRPLAEQGLAEAQADLAIMYLNGEGVPQDYAGATKWFRLSAEQGYIKAQVYLGGMHRLGTVVPQDYAEGMKWYRLAAEQGDGAAQYSLGVMYARGEGVPQDYVQAHVWYNLAAARLPPGQARGLAASGRKTVEGQMTPPEVAEAQRLAREWKPK